MSLAFLKWNESNKHFERRVLWFALHWVDNFIKACQWLFNQSDFSCFPWNVYITRAYCFGKLLTTDSSASWGLWDSNVCVCVCPRPKKSNLSYLTPSSIWSKYGEADVKNTFKYNVSHFKQLQRLWSCLLLV